jgi:methionyl-tRNA synthetase
MSKSLGNVINPLDYIKQFGIDSLRYYLMKEIPLENDGVFSHELFIELYNSDLANIYGNLVSRFLGMINLYNEGKITTSNTGDSESVTAFINDINFLLNNIEEKINSFKMNEVLKLILEFGKSTNKFIQENKP